MRGKTALEAATLNLMRKVKKRVCEEMVKTVRLLGVPRHTQFSHIRERAQFKPGNRYTLKQREVCASLTNAFVGILEVLFYT